MSKGPGNPYHDKEGKFSSGPATGHNAGGGNRSIAKQVAEEHSYASTLAAPLLKRTRSVNSYNEILKRQRELEGQEIALLDKHTRKIIKSATAGTHVDLIPKGHDENRYIHGYTTPSGRFYDRERAAKRYKKFLMD